MNAERALTCLLCRIARVTLRVGCFHFTATNPISLDDDDPPRSIKNHSSFVADINLLYTYFDINFENLYCRQCDESKRALAHGDIYLRRARAHANNRTDNTMEVIYSFINI